ncbi:MAG TPA: MFS transporter [Planctomycetaceae bacterium]
MPEPRASHVRHLIVAVTVLMSVILYLDRFCVSFAERYIKEDLGLGETQMAWFVSGFFCAYALAQVPSGWLGDRWGSRGVLALYIVSWSFFTATIGMATGFAMLLAMRLGCGLSQAGAYPTAGSILSRWVPFSTRGFASGLVALGGRLGAVIAPILTAYLMVVFVPLSTPSRLNERSILDGPALCARLSPLDHASSATTMTPIEQRIGQRLPKEAQWIVAKYGSLYREFDRIRRSILADSQQREKSKPTADSRQPTPIQTVDSPAKLNCDPDELQTLAAGLNGLLADDDLFDEQDFKRLKSSEREALNLEARRVRGESLSAAETARLNRLFLEGLFPKEIGKLYVNGWRPVMLVYGIAGIAVAGAFWFCFRNSPAEHPWCNMAERTLITGETVVTSALPEAEPTRLPVRAILHSVSLWLSSISQFGTNAAWLFFVTYLPRYLMEIHNVPILERSWMTAIPPIAGIAGMFLGGCLTDSLVRRIGLRWGRALPMSLTRFFAAATYLACLWIKSPWPATIAFALGFFFVDLGVSATWAFMQDVGGKHVGAILGWGNMWGNVGAAVAPFIYQRVLGNNPVHADWNAMFMVCAALFVLSGLAALGINATVPIVSDSGATLSDAIGQTG